MRLVLIRHGQTPSNVAGILDTLIPGPELTAVGHAQAAALAVVLDEPIGAIFASIQIRSQQTAAPLAARLGLEVHIREDAREIDCGVFEMRQDKDALDGYHAAFFGWAAGDRDRRIPGAENGHEVYERFNRVIAEAEASGENTVALIVHGAIIRAWVGAHAQNAGEDFARKNPMPNTGVAVVNGSTAAGWSLESWDGRALAPVELPIPLP